MFLSLQILEIFFANVFPICRNLSIMFKLNSSTSKTPLAKVNSINNKQHSGHYMLKTKGVSLCV